MASRLLTALGLCAALLAQYSSAECYMPNGSKANWEGSKSNYVSCAKNGQHAMCCNKAYSDTCRSNGLCYNAGAKLLWRESCTDPTWNDPACIKLCASNQICMFSSKRSRRIIRTDADITCCSIRRSTIQRNQHGHHCMRRRLSLLRRCEGGSIVLREQEGIPASGRRTSRLGTSARRTGTGTRDHKGSSSPKQPNSGKVNTCAVASRAKARRAYPCTCTCTCILR